MCIVNKMCKKSCFFFFFFNDTATTEIYTLSLHDALPIFIAVLGISMKILWINMPRKLSSALYIAMGWVAIFVIKDLYINLDARAFFLLVLGGILYTIGGVIYAIKKPNLKVWNFHDIFHIFKIGR